MARSYTTILGVVLVACVMGPIALAADKVRAPAGWPSEVKTVSYPSPAAGTPQRTLFYDPGGPQPVPLLVALHTWSSNYQQNEEPYATWCIAKRWVMVHPDFRGPNRRPEACGSELAVKDIVGAVDHACRVAPIDRTRIYLMGASGGGYASLLMAGRAPEIWAGVSAYVPIFDLAAWYHESVARKSGYAKDAVACCGGAPGSSRKADREFKRRSAKTWLARAKNVSLDINAGIADGHTGSVPISHSLRAFNLLAAPKDRLTDAEIDYFVRRQAVPRHLRQPIEDATYGDHPPLFRRASRKVRVTIFQGGHDELFEAGLSWLEQQRKS